MASRRTEKDCGSPAAASGAKRDDRRPLDDDDSDEPVWSDSDSETSSSDDDDAPQPPPPKRLRRRLPRSPCEDSSATLQLGNAASGAKTENGDLLTHYLSRPELRKLTGQQRDELTALMKVAATQSHFCDRATAAAASGAEPEEQLPRSEKPARRKYHFL